MTCLRVIAPHNIVRPSTSLWIFPGFLSQDMTYSCAIFETLDGDLEGDSVNRGEWSGGQGLKRLGQNASIDRSSVASGASTNTKDGLHEGQLRKLKHIIHKARISPGHRVLEIGSGWGSMAIQIASTIPDTVVDSLTLSVQQQALAIERVKAAGLEDRITIHLMDYRNMPAEWEGAFDRLISIEMIEAVGQEFLEKYWSTVNWALKRVGGAGVVQVITLPEPRKSPLQTCIPCPGPYSVSLD
jgi:cyclopropane-fatty-acyl-phospholipid synthase